MMSEACPQVPKKWFFYNLKQSIDDAHKAYSAAALDSFTSSFADASGTPSEPPTPIYSTSTIRKAIYPVTEWIAFNPGDNRRLLDAKPGGDPVAVGHDRLLFQVHDLDTLRPIYWSLPYSTKVTSCHWTFASTLTPIDPNWDSIILEHFHNFLANIETYRETLEMAVTEPALVRVISPCVELKQNGRDMILDVAFSPKNNNVYLFKGGSSLCSTATATSLLQGEDPRGALVVLRPFDFEDYKKLYRPKAELNDQPSDNPDYEPLPINRLILVFHGIGQKLSDNYSRINFVYAIDKLRVLVTQAAQSQDIYKHFPGGTDTSVRYLVLPVNWRNALNSDVDFDLETITVPSMLAVRQAVGDALLDIPLYMSEKWRPRMLSAAAKEANRIYDLVVKNNPSFKEHGKVNILGHSLGSLITADLLTHQPTHLNAKTAPQAPLKFETDNFFLTGSMLGLFMLLKGERLRSRSEFDKLHSDIDPQDRPLGCFAVRNIFNIINQSDVLCFLINSTVDGANEAGAMGLVGESGLALESDTLPIATFDKPRPSKATSENTSPAPQETTRRSSIGKFLSAQISRATKGTPSPEPDPEDKLGKTSLTETPPKVNEVLARFKTLNENGQLDYKIPSPASFMSSHYLKMFTAHFDYWSNRELAQLLALECGRLPGLKHTIPEHRTKWTFRPEASTKDPQK